MQHAAGANVVYGQKRKAADGSSDYEFHVDQIKDQVCIPLLLHFYSTFLFSLLSPLFSLVSSSSLISFANQVQVVELAKLEDSAQKEFWAIKLRFSKNMYYPKRG